MYTQKQLDLLEDTAELKHFGLGPYFFIQFFRRMTWLMFILSLFEGVRIYIDWIGTGLNSYTSSFSTYLIQTTLGNYSLNKFTPYDGYIMTGIPGLCFLSLFLFYLCWKGHISSEINTQQEDNSVVKAEKFCLQIQGLEESHINEPQLERFFSSFGPVYQVSLIRRYKNKLSYFEELDQLEEQIKEEELQIILGSGDKNHIKSLKKEKDALNKEINELRIHPKTISAYIHYQFQKSKVDCLTYFNNHYLFNSCSHACMRNTCCCCVDSPEEKYLFRGQKLYIKNDKVPPPDDINWLSFQINWLSRFCRGFFAFMIIIIFLALSCTIIGLCSIYITAHQQSCENVTVPTDLPTAQASTSTTAQYCYCSSNLISSFSNADIKSFCNSYFTQIYTSQAIQYGIIITSSVTNFLFGFIVDKLVNCVRPSSNSSALTIKTFIYTIFLVINSIILPILIYANIFGFQAANYVSFLTIISTDIKSFLSVSSLSFYPDISSVWYQNVSPIFTNFLIINTVMVWIWLIIDKYTSSKGSLKDDEGKILQKHMNQEITSYKLNVYKDTSNFYLIIFMVFFLFTGIPVLMPLGFINILSRYLVGRSLFQNNSSKIEGLGEDFSMIAHTFLPIILIFAPLLGCWMLTGNSNIYNPTASTPILPTQFPVLSNIVYELTRELYLSWFLIIALLALLEFTLYNTLIRFCSCLCSLCYDKKNVVHPYHTRPFTEYAKGMNILTSYNIRNNDEFRNAILNLEKHLVETDKI